MVYSENSGIAVPLNELRKKGDTFFWGETQQRAFETLKQAIISPPVLLMPDFSQPFVLQTDASSVALGVIMSQVTDDVRQPVAFTSRTLTAQERKYSAYELELIRAVAFSLDKFRCFLERAESLTPGN